MRPQDPSSLLWEIVISSKQFSQPCLSPHISRSLYFPSVVQNASLRPVLSAILNLTVLVPSQQATEDMDQDEKSFWLSQSNIPALIKQVLLILFYTVSEWHLCKHVFEVQCRKTTWSFKFVELNMFQNSPFLPPQDSNSQQLLTANSAKHCSTALHITQLILSITQ